MPIENIINRNINTPFNLQENQTSLLASTPSSPPDYSDTDMYHTIQSNENITTSGKDKLYQFYISQMKALLHDISRQGNLSDNVNEKINHFIEELSYTDCIPESLKLGIYDDVCQYLHGLMRLLEKENTSEIQDYLRKMYIYIEKGIGIALNIIPACYEKINSMVSDEIYKKILTAKKQLIKKTVYEYVLKVHGLINADAYLNAYEYHLSDTPWGFDYTDNDKTIDIEKIAETDDTLCGLMQQLTMNISLGKIIRPVGDEVYESILKILKKNTSPKKKESLCYEKTNTIINYLQQNYPILCFTDCIKFDKSTNKFVRVYPDMIYSAIAIALAKHDISQRYFQIGLALETIKIRIRYVEGFYWIENKTTGINSSLNLNILKREKISGILDEDLLKFAIINSDINQITNNLAPEWFDKPENICYEIEHHSIFIAAAHFFTENRLPINNTYKNGMTFLMAAVILKNKMLIHHSLTRSDLDINIKNNMGMTALTLAIESDFREIAYYLLAYKKIDVNIQDNKGITPLILATQTGKSPVINKLLRHRDINVNMQDCKGNTALFYAIISGQKVIIKQLINDKRTDINIVNNDGYSVLFMSLTKELSIVKNIINHKSIDINGNNTRTIPLIKAVTEDRLDIVKLLLSFPNLNINRCDEAGNTALHIAIAMDNERMVDALSSMRLINMEIVDNDGLTPLELAIKRGNENIIKNLLINKQINDKASPRMPIGK